VSFEIANVEWKSIVRAVAPALATALGTPLAGVATKVITDALLGEDAPEQLTEEVLADAVKSASPDQLIELKKANLQFEADMAKLGVDIAKIEAGDRADARQREIVTGDPKGVIRRSDGGFFRDSLLDPELRSPGDWRRCAARDAWFLGDSVDRLHDLLFWLDSGVFPED
jgi:hypothetical protein